VWRLQDPAPEGERVVALPGENLKAAKWRLAVDLVAQASTPAGSGSVSLPEGTPGVTSALRPQPELARRFELLAKIGQPHFRDVERFVA
jgi:hypothetical protein